MEMETMIWGFGFLALLVLIVAGIKATRRKTYNPQVLLDVISDLHTANQGECDPHAVFASILEGFLIVTESEYGFIGEIVKCENNPPYLKTWAITDIAWNEETRKYFKDGYHEGLDFTNLETLFGFVIKNEEMVISNNVSADKRSGKNLPHGHPALNSFLGLPIFLRGEMIGMVGIANRPGGYTEEIVRQIDPFVRTLGSLVMVNLRSKDCC